MGGTRRRKGGRRKSNEKKGGHYTITDLDRGTSQRVSEETPRLLGCTSLDRGVGLDIRGTVVGGTCGAGGGFDGRRRRSRWLERRGVDGEVLLLTMRRVDRVSETRCRIRRRYVQQRVERKR